MSNLSSHPSNYTQGATSSEDQPAMPASIGETVERAHTGAKLELSSSQRAISLLSEFLASSSEQKMRTLEAIRELLREDAGMQIREAMDQTNIAPKLYELGNSAIEFPDARTKIWALVDTLTSKIEPLELARSWAIELRKAYQYGVTKAVLPHFAALRPDADETERKYSALKLNRMSGRETGELYSVLDSDPARVVLHTEASLTHCALVLEVKGIDPLAARNLGQCFSGGFRTDVVVGVWFDANSEVVKNHELFHLERSLTTGIDAFRAGAESCLIDEVGAFILNEKHELSRLDVVSVCELAISDWRANAQQVIARGGDNSNPMSRAVAECNSAELSRVNAGEALSPAKIGAFIDVIDQALVTQKSKSTQFRDAFLCSTSLDEFLSHMNAI